LFKNGANATIAKLNNAAFLIAVRNEDEDMVKLLLSNGADIHALGDSSLLIAVTSGNKSMVDFLLKR